MDNSNTWINAAFLLLIAGTVTWFGYIHSKDLGKWEKMYYEIEPQIEQLKQENLKLREENFKLKNSVDYYNKINYSVLTSVIDEYSKLKDENLSLKEENDKTKENLKNVSRNGRHVQMIIH